MKLPESEEKYQSKFITHAMGKTILLICRCNNKQGSLTAVKVVEKDDPDIHVVYELLKHGPYVIRWTNF